MKNKGVAKALIKWAKGYDPTLKLNAVCEHEGDRALITSSAVVSESYINGLTDKRLDFALVLIEPWSEHFDTVNEEALAYGEAWLDWVYANPISDFPYELLECEPDDLEPVIVQVMSDSLCAKYQFQAHVIYRS